jgi:hypothetical protein
MNLDVLGPQLHHRSTLDEPLSAEEQVLLDTWYAEQDAIEAAILAKSQVVLPDLNELQGAIDRTLTQLSLSVQQLQTITQQNKSLRKENAQLKQQLTTQIPTPFAWDLVEKIYIQRTIAAGLADSAAGRIKPVEDVRKMFGLL